MKRRTGLTTLLLMVVLALPAFSQLRNPRTLDFASNFQTVPVMSNVTGVNGAQFQTYVAILNPGASSISVEATLYDAAGLTHNNTITLAAGELKTYTNFLSTAFGFTGGGAVTFRIPASDDGTNSKRFIVNTEIKTVGGHYGTQIPALEFAGSSSRSFSPGVSVDSTWRTNVGCFNQSGSANTVKATILDNTGHVTIGSVTLNLGAHAWGQTALSSVVSGGYVQFDPADSAVCYAVVVNNTTNDGRFIPAAEYQP